MGVGDRKVTCALLAVLALAGVIVSGCDSEVGAVRRAEALPSQGVAVTHGDYVTERLTLPTGYGSAGRPFVLHARRAGRTPWPLVLVLHGLHQTPQTVETATGAAAFSQAQHFTLVFPVGEHKAWNAGGCCDGARTNDVGYLVDLVHYVASLTPVDLHHVYVWGFSNGGMMAWRAACQTSGVFAGVGVVAGALLVACPHPVHVVDIHGLRDTTVPYFGGYSTFTHTVFPSSVNVRRQLAPGSTFQLVLSNQLGHRWPTPRIGGIDALEVLWQGLDRFASLPAAQVATPATG